jgi:hypothetical protein
VAERREQLVDLFRKADERLQALRAKRGNHTNFN